jgi:hypothetical protein
MAEVDEHTEANRSAAVSAIEQIEDLAAKISAAGSDAAAIEVYVQGIHAQTGNLRVICGALDEDHDHPDDADAQGADAGNFGGAFAEAHEEAPPAAEAGEEHADGEEAAEAGEEHADGEEAAEQPEQPAG